jgi:AcrR family transcriptional regulator
MTVAAERLPRGRHGLSPGEVVTSQRRRMFQAMAEATTTKGYAATTVADVLTRAGVSRETFYQQFASKRACFEAAFDDATQGLFGWVGGVPAGDPSPADRFDRLLAVYLDALAAAPDLARLCLIEVYAAGPELVERRAAVQQRFADRVKVLLGAKDAESVFACEALVAAVSSMVVARLAAGDLDGLRALRAPFATLVRHALT